MQAGQSVPSSGSHISRTRTIITTALVLFALGGLMSGFAIGAFTRSPKTAGNPTPIPHPTQAVVQQTVVPTLTPVQRPVALGYPVFSSITSTEIADGTSSYTVSIQVVDQSIDKAHGKPVHVAGIACKVWLTKDAHVSDNIKHDIGRLKSNATLQSLQAAFPGEEPNSLTFSSTQQTQPTNSNGQGTWTYNVAQTVQPGNYFLVVLVDWGGTHYNWSWQIVKVEQAGS